MRVSQSPSLHLTLAVPTIITKIIKIIQITRVETTQTNAKETIEIRIREEEEEQVIITIATLRKRVKTQRRLKGQVTEVVEITKISSNKCNISKRTKAIMLISHQVVPKQQP